MRVRRWMQSGRDHLGLLVVLAMLVALWQTLQAAATFTPDPESASQRAVASILRAAPGILKPGDVVLVSSPDAALHQALGQFNASVAMLDASTAAGAGSPLLRLLDDACTRAPLSEQPAIYWIWTAAREQAPVALGAAARALNFFYTFQAVLPYQDDAAFAIDKFLRLQPKDDIIQRYCEARRLAGSRPVLLILDAERFSPWIGSVKTGSLTWLSSSPQRTMTESQFAVKDMPPLLTYDVYWLGQVPMVPHWTFENQDAAAYERALQQAREQNAIVLMDRKARLGENTARLLEKCQAGTISIESSLFHQMCLR